MTESGAHLLVCTQLPQADQQALAAVLQRISTDIGPGPAAAPDILVSPLLSLSWRNQSDESIQLALACLASFTIATASVSPRSLMAPVLSGQCKP
jgi:hypothetical protein